MPRALASSWGRDAQDGAQSFEMGSRAPSVFQDGVESLGTRSRVPGLFQAELRTRKRANACASFGESLDGLRPLLALLAQEDDVGLQLRLRHLAEQRLPPSAWPAPRGICGTPDACSSAPRRRVHQHLAQTRQRPLLLLALLRRADPRGVDDDVGHQLRFRRLAGASESASARVDPSQRQPGTRPRRHAQTARPRRRLAVNRDDGDGDDRDGGDDDPRGGETTTRPR